MWYEGCPPAVDGIPGACGSDGKWQRDSNLIFKHGSRKTVFGLEGNNKVCEHGCNAYVATYAGMSTKLIFTFTTASRWGKRVMIMWFVELLNPSGCMCLQIMSTLSVPGIAWEILRVEFWMLDFQQPHLQSLWNTLRLLHVFTTVFWRIRSRALGWERGIRVGECKLVCPHSTVVWAWHVLLYQVQCRKKVAHRC